MKDVQDTFLAFCVQGMASCHSFACVAIGAACTMIGVGVIKLIAKVFKK